MVLVIVSGGTAHSIPLAVYPKNALVPLGELWISRLASPIESEEMYPPDNVPLNAVADNLPVLGLNERLVLVSIPCEPVVPSTKVTYTVSSVVWLAVAVTEVARVAVDALPEVSCDPLVLTPGRLMLADPSKLTPPIVLAVAKVVAVEARATAMLADPSKLVPPIVRAFAYVVAVDALPLNAPAKVVLVSTPELGL